MIALLLLAAAPADAFADIPNVTIETYSVRGTSVDEVRRSMNAVRPTDPNDDLRVDALSRWYWRWRWPGNGQGGCDLAKASVSFSAIVRLPRLEGDTTDTTRARFDAYIDALSKHEARHVRAAWGRREQLAAAIAGATCSTANVAAQRIVAEIAAGDRKYDRTTQHGSTEGARFP